MCCENRLLPLKSCGNLWLEVFQMQVIMDMRLRCTLLSIVCVLFLCSSVGLSEIVAEGVTLVPLTNDGKSKAVAWAYHGDWVAFVHQVGDSRQWQLHVMKPDGSEAKPACPVGDVFFAEWSWAGDRIVYEFSNASEGESQAAVYSYDINQNRSTTVSPPYRRNNLDADDGPFWSPDDRYLAYTVSVGLTHTPQVWLIDAATQATWQLLPERGQARDQRWSASVPPRLSLLVQAGGRWDVVTVKPDGRGLVMITDIGSESLAARSPRWSPVDDVVAFTFDKDMTQSERGRRCDAWVARADGSVSTNLTRASTPATENQLELDDPIWSWDGRYILFKGDRFDIQGNDIPTLYLVDPNRGGYQVLLTSHPREDGTLDDFEVFKWSYDSTKIALLTKRSTIRNWGPDARSENRRTVLSLYDLVTRSVEDLLVLSDEQDRKQMEACEDRDDGVANISWSPDSQSLLVTISRIISKADSIVQPDVYRVDLPERLISPLARTCNGPPIGLGAPMAASEPSGGQQQEQRPGGTAAESAAPEPSPADSGMVTQTIEPSHMTVVEALASLPSKYGQYVTPNASRNLFLFMGPAALLAELQRNLKLIDTPATQILVDLLAVELTDEANRELGLDWTYAKGRFGMFQPMGNAIRDLSPDATLDGLTTYPGTGQVFYQGVGRLPEEFFVRLNALVQDGKGTILTNPRTVAVSGQEAMIQIRKTLNYFFNEGYDVSGRPIVKKSDISADTQGRITPTLLADGRISMAVSVKVGSFTFTPDAGLPEQVNRESTTTVIVREGQTLVIGGLREQEMSQAVVKVPVLGDMPLIGPLFRKTQKATRNSVLTLFITPHVLLPDAPSPNWPQLDPNDHTIQPIMRESVSQDDGAHGEG
jgi:type II secretory pathway component GspD/PulD (secretin)